MAQYGFRIECKPGLENIAADYLSRRPDYQHNKSKHAHFADQRGFPLEQVKLFKQSDEIVTAWKRTISAVSSVQKPSIDNTITNVPISTSVPLISTHITNAELFAIESWLKKNAL